MGLVGLHPRLSRPVWLLPGCLLCLWDLLLFCLSSTTSASPMETMVTFLGLVLVLAVCTFVSVLEVVTEGWVLFEDSVDEFAEQFWFCMFDLELERLSFFVADGEAVIGGSLVEASGAS